MAQVNSIRELFFEKGLTYAEIARTTGHDVKTVKKYIMMGNFNEPLPKPRQVRGSKLDVYKSQIDEWLEQDKQERRKQRHTAKRVFELLAEKHPDFDCSYRLVARYVSKRKKEIYGEPDKFYMPLVHIPGEAQVDFGEADFLENNVRCKGHYLNVSFPNSNAGYLQLFKGENMQCLAEGLMNIFEHIKGVPTRLWFDNLTPAVKDILKYDEREMTEKFLRFKNHYGFAVAFCNPGCGHEKGSVENKVGYHRRNMLVPVPRIDDLRLFNKQLLKQGDQDMERLHYRKRRLHRDLFEEDRRVFLPLPSVRCDESEVVVVRTDSYAKFTLNKGKHTYSSAPRYAKSQIFAKLTAHDVIVLDENYREIVRHARIYGDYYQEKMEWLPYLTQLSRRPAALKYTGIYPMLPNEIQQFLDSCSYQAKKDTLRILAKLTEKSSFSQATQAVRAVIVHNARDVDSVVAMFNRLNSDIVDLDPMVLPANVPEIPPVKPNLNNYDRMFLREVGHCES